MRKQSFFLPLPGIKEETEEQIRAELSVSSAENSELDLELDLYSEAPSLGEFEISDIIDDPLEGALEDLPSPFRGFSTPVPEQQEIKEESEQNEDAPAQLQSLLFRSAVSSAPIDIAPTSKATPTLRPFYNQPN